MHITRPNTQEFEQAITLAKQLVLDVSEATPRQFWIVKEQEQVVGCVRAINRGPLVELATLGVLPTSEKKGIGATLVHHMQQHHSSLHLVCVIPEYFEKLGFKRVLVTPEQLLPKVNNCALWHGYGTPVVMKWTN